ncbi:MAG: hypothetical protein JJ979_02550 [Roseibium sp.]|nr:hypothetical protein [Roseibium sp.]
MAKQHPRITVAEAMKHGTVEYFDAGNDRAAFVLSCAAHGHVSYLTVLNEQKGGDYIRLRSDRLKVDALEYAKKRAKLMLRAAVKWKRLKVKEQRRRYVERQSVNEAWGAF